MLETPGVNNQTLPVDDGRSVRRIRVPATTVLGQTPRIFHHLTAVLGAACTGQSLRRTHISDTSVGTGPKHDTHNSQIAICLTPDVRSLLSR